MGCIAVYSGIALLDSCTSVKYLNANINGDYLDLPLTAFTNSNNTENEFHEYLVVQNARLKYPICVYRVSNDTYRALLMRCTHQGTELRAFDDRLQCPAHGSEFSNTGEVQNGPADTGLRTFPIVIENNLLKIDLR